MNYCSNCGSDKIAFKIPEHDTYHRFICENCGIIHYQNPLVVVGCLVLNDDGKIMLCKRNIEPQFGLWNLPAGFMENGETAEEGAVRETWEESNAEVEIIRLHAVFSLPQVNHVYLHYLAKMTKPGYSPTHESSEVEFFTLDDIPWDDIAFESVNFSLRKFVEHGMDHKTAHLGKYIKKERWM